MATIKHGTYAGFLQCRNSPGKACPACRKASSDYVTAWRKRNPESQKRTIINMRRREKAMRILAKRHSVELQSIIDDLKYAEAVKLLAELDAPSESGKIK